MSRNPEHNKKIGESLRARGVGSSETKNCPRCGETKPRTDFAVRTNGYSESYCRPCKKSYRSPGAKKRPWNPDRGRKSRYGMAVGQYDAMLDEQDGLCAGCGRDGVKLFVDHNHESGLVRGLLCPPCNLSLGLAGDRPEILESAAKYLLENQK